MTYSVFIPTSGRIRPFYNVKARSPESAAAKACGLAFGSVVPEVRVTVMPTNSVDSRSFVVGSKL